MKKKKKILKSVLVKREKRKIRREERERWNMLRDNVKITQGNHCYICEKEVFGKSAHIHHIISRDIKELKYDRLNLVLLCPVHHKLGSLSVHQTSIYFSELLRKREPERYYYLLSRINN